MTQQLPPPGWYPEPISPTGQRYWDGARWTEQVEPPQPTPPTVPPGQAAAAGGWQSSRLFSVPAVRIEQQGRVMESASVYDLTDLDRVPLGQAVQVGQGRGGRLLKAMSDLDRNMPVTIQFRNAARDPVLTLSKPGGVGPQRFVLTDPAGREIGQINQKIRAVREAFDIVVAGQPAGALASENWYDRRFSVLDGSGRPYAQVHKLYEGYARARFTSADIYVVEVADQASTVQRAVALGAAIAMDIALYQR